MAEHANEPARAHEATVTRREPRKNPAAPEKPADPNEAVVKDANGRTIKLRKTTPLIRYRVAKILGSESSTNLGLLGLAWAAASVVEIDGDPVFFPAQERELEHLLQRLDDAGINAINQAYVDNGWSGVGAEIDRDAAGN